MKKVLKVLLATGAVFALMLTTTFALPSQSKNGEVVGNVIVDGKAMKDLTVTFEKEFTKVTTEVVKDINNLNSGVKVSTVLTDKKVNLPNGLKLDNLVLLTEVQPLTVRDQDGKVKVVRNATVTWEVPNMVAEVLGDMYVMYYNVETNTWEIILPDSIDYKNKTVTATFAYLSETPVAIVYVPTGDNVKKDEKNVKTGDNSQIALYAGGAVIALAIIGVIVYKTKKEN